MPLIPCPGCARHLREQERACPFCGAALARRRAASPGLTAAAGALALLASGCPDRPRPAPPYGTPDPAPVVSDDAPATPPPLPGK